MVFGAENVVSLFKRANEFTEDEGYSVVDEDDLDGSSGDDELSVEDLVRTDAEKTEKADKAKKKNKKTKNQPRGPEDWSLDDNWFITKPEVAEGVVSRSLTHRIGKGLHVQKGFKVWIDGRAVKKTSFSTTDKEAAPGQAFYNHSNGMVSFPYGSEGKSFKVEYHLQNKKGENLFQTEEEEQKSISSLKSRSRSLWENIINHPDPNFVRDHIIPIIEDELDHLRDEEKKKKKGKPESVPNLTGELMTLEQLLHRLDEDDATYSKDDLNFKLEDTFIEFDDIELPAGAELRTVSFRGGDTTLKQVEGDPDPGEFVVEGDALLFNEEDVGKTVEVAFNRPSNTKELTVSFIKEKIAPKLENLTSLAQLVSEQVYDMQSGDDDDSSASQGLPGLERARSLDPQFLRYVQRVRGDSASLEREASELARFHTPKIAQMLRAGRSTYFATRPGDTSIDDKTEKSYWKNTVGPVFEAAGLTIDDLHKVALDALVQGIMDFNYDQEGSKDHKTALKIHGNPFIWQGVKTALKGLYDKYKEDSSQKLKTTGSETITVPNGGGVVKLPNSSGMSSSSVKIVSPDGSQLKQVGGFSFTAVKGRGDLAFLRLRGDMADGSASPFLSGNFASPDAQDATPTEIIVRNSEGEEFRRVSKVSEVKGSSDKVFYLGTSRDKNLSLPSAYVGETFTVLVSGKGAAPTAKETTLGKNQYTVDSPKGTITFSSQNSGDKVIVTFNRTIKTKRFVSPSVGTDSDGEDTGPITENISEVDTLEDENTDKNAERIIKVIESILYDPKEKRLNLRERALLMGLFGIGNDGKRLSIREIAQEEPFNYDLVKNKSSVSQLKKELQPEATQKLIEILKEKIGDDSQLDDIIRSRSFKKVSDEKPADADKILSYLQETSDKYSKNVRNILGNVLSKAKLKEDEENILRWLWGLQGPLRRDSAEQGDHRLSVLEGGPPVPLAEVIAEEFLTEEERHDPELEKATISELRPHVEATYSRALDKFQKVLDFAIPQLEKLVGEKEWAHDFLGYYQRARKRDDLVDLADDDGFRTPPPMEKKEPVAVPLFDQIKNRAQSVSPIVLKGMLKELDKSQKKGKNLSTLIEERSRITEGLSDGQLKTSEDLVETYMDTRNNLAETNNDLSAVRNALKDTLLKIRESADGETQQAIAEALAAKSIASNKDEVSKASESYEKAMLAARGKAAPDLRKEFNDSTAEEKKLKKDVSDLTALVGKQKEAIQKGYKDIPELRAKRELEVLREVEKFFTSNKKYHLGGGKYNLAQLFEIKKLDKSKKYKAPKWEPPAEGEEEYRPRNREIHMPARKVKKEVPVEDASNKDKAPPAGKLSIPKTRVDPEQVAKLLVRSQDGLVEEEAEFLSKIIGMLEQGKPLSKIIKGLKASDKESAKIPLAMAKRLSVYIRRYPDSKVGGKFDFSKMYGPDPRQLPSVSQADRMNTRSTNKSLYEQLLSFALPIEDQTAKQRVDEVTKFKTLMNNMQEFVQGRKSRPDVTDGKGNVKTKGREETRSQGTVDEFIQNPGTAKNELLNEEEGVLSRVREFLRDYASDIQTGEGNWDLTKLFVQREVPKEPETEMDRSPSDKDSEALQNSQDLSEGESKLLHFFIQNVEKGKSLSSIIDSFKNKKNTGAVIAGRLKLWTELHPERKSKGQYDFSKLYSGEDRLPSRKSLQRSLPLLEQIGPLVDSVYSSSRGEDSKPGEQTESKRGIRVKIEDMLERMEDMVQENYDLSEMAEEFEQLDDNGATPYSLAYLFQFVRNYLQRLNRSSGLQNMEKNFSLDKVFPDGAPLEDPADSAETTPARPTYEVEDETPDGFPAMAKELDLDEKEAGRVLQVLRHVQVVMQDSGDSATEILMELSEKKGLREIADTIRLYFQNHRRAVESDYPGIPDLSNLTGIPFEAPDVSEEEAEAKAEEAPQEQPAAATPPQPKPAPKAPTKNYLSKIVTKLEEMDAKTRESFIRALVDKPDIAPPAVIYEALMTADIPPKEVLKLRALVSYEEEGMGMNMPDPKDHGVAEDEPEETPQEIPQTPKKPKKTKTKAKRGRLSKELTDLDIGSELAQEIAEEFDEATDPGDVSPTDDYTLLDNHIGGWDEVTSYRELTELGKSHEEDLKALKKKDVKEVLKAWNLLRSIWRNYLRDLTPEDIDRIKATQLTEEEPKDAPAVDPEPAPAVEPEPAPKPTGPAIGRDQLFSAIKTLSTQDKSSLQAALRQVAQLEALPSELANTSLDTWRRWQTLVTDKKQVDALTKLVRALNGPVPQAVQQTTPTEPAPAPKPNAQLLTMLMERAVKVSLSKGWDSADKFEEIIRAGKPELLEAYSEIKQKVQDSIDALSDF